MPGGDRFFQPDEVVGGFQIGEILGQGGMGQVYEAHDLLLGRMVALKAARARPGGRLSYLRKEGQALTAINHPALVTVYGMGVHGDIEYLVMERIHGVTLEAMLDQAERAPFAIVEAVELLARVAEGLVAIHAAGIAHRDIKPSNIMVAGGRRVVLMDLGIFRPEFAERTADITGTPHYMAPETILNEQTPGSWHLVDLYALGVIGFELLTGRPPFLGEEVAAILKQQLETPPPDLIALRPDTPEALANLIGELLAKEPRDRPVSAEQVFWRLLALQKEPALPHAPRSVLVIDDDPDARALLAAAVRRVLRESDVVTASGARDALACLARRKPDLILVDLQMPEMSGVELCMYLRGAGLASTSTIIGVSGHAGAADIELLRRLGVHELVPKGPGTTERLGAAIRAIYAPAGR